MTAHHEPSLNHSLLSGFSPVAAPPVPWVEKSLKPRVPGAEDDTVMRLDRVTVFDPALLVAVRLTEYVPAAVYVWFGFCTVAVAPSPKFHAHAVGDPVEVSLNCTAKGADPVVGDAVNAATGATAVETVRYVTTRATDWTGPTAFRRS